MILPTKHIPLEISLLGAGAIILDQMKRPQTITSLWDRARELPEIGTFERFALALDFLYIIGAIELEEGLLRRCET
ncbi:MAG: hypothetical protein IMW93_06640 [Thermoanaerobacteraceae bacterium]|nr:hypothetical protein [Thermoanaerobacteraceae bacterium]